LPTSNSARAVGTPASELTDNYMIALDRFIERHVDISKQSAVISLYHAVRNIPYFSSGNRSPEAVLRDNRGACTAKHLLLRDLLRRRGELADVELIEGDFAASMPVVNSMPDEMKIWIRSGGIKDYHCYVVWRGPEREQILDATWPDALARYGFTVNSEWQGEGDTALAIVPTFIKSRVEDVIPRKEKLLLSLSREETHHRKLFLSLLSTWLASLPDQ
jgi:hypothetical protein